MISLVLVFMLSCLPVQAYADEKLMLFCGAALKRPMDEIVMVFEKTTDIKVDVVYGAVGTLLAQMEFIKRGDIFVSPSEDMMAKTKKKGLVVNKTLKNIVYFVPCINVQKGNPKNIKGLKDLTREGIKIAIANPEFVYIGMLATEIIDKNLNDREKADFKKNLITHAEDFNKLAMFVALKQIDAIIGFHFLEGWYPDKIENVKLDAKQLSRIGAAQAGIVNFSKSNAVAQKFLDFLHSEKTRSIFKKYHYFSSPEEAFQWLGGRKIIGGEYPVANDWIHK